LPPFEYPLQICPIIKVQKGWEAVTVLMLA
jgi:hypothetical protein